jgi:DNA-binding response OmpR family regulator
MSKRILIIEDDNSILQLEKDYLEANNFEVTTAIEGKQGLTLALTGNFNLIILDIMLPGIDGLEICKQIRNISNVPILLVSAKREEFDKIKGLGIGADDYIVKPFSPSELVARVVAHINRYERLINAHPEDSSIIELGILRIDKNSRRVFVNGEEIIFTNKEFDLLAFLAENPDTVFKKETLFKEIWQYDSMGETSTVTVHINRIRDKLMNADESIDYIHTIWGQGYRFIK